MARCELVGVLKRYGLFNEGGCPPDGCDGKTCSQIGAGPDGLHGEATQPLLQIADLINHFTSGKPIVKAQNRPDAWN